MGSFNFKEAAFYRQSTVQLIGEHSASIKSLEQLRGEAQVDIRDLPLDIKLSKFQGKLPFPLSSIGLLRVRQPHSNKVFDGSCALIGPKILLTCAHNLYSYQSKTFYKQLDYFPCRNGAYNIKINIKISPETVKIHPYFYQYQTSQHEKFDYGIIMLQKSMSDLCGCVEVAVNYQTHQNGSLYLFGYPIKQNNVKNQATLHGAKGTIIKKTESILFYNMETGAGQSGAPIFVQNQGIWKIIGVHTLSDPSGVFINSDVARTINEWAGVQASTLVIQNGRKVFGVRSPKLSKMIQGYQWQSLIALTFNNCNINTQNLAHLNRTSWNIKIFILDYNRIDRMILDASKFKQLQKLFLNSNLVRTIEDEINSFYRLTLLSLRKNPIKKVQIKISSPLLKIIMHENKCEFGEGVDMQHFQV